VARFILICALLLAAFKPVTINTHGAIFNSGIHGRVSVTFDVHVVLRPENRLLDVVWYDEAGEVGRSQKDFEVENRSTFRMTANDLEPGEYEIRATLYATDGQYVDIAHIQVN